jgi:hypothetical protein
MREYVDKCHKSGGMRHIPIGLVVADTDREANAMYYNCREPTSYNNNTRRSKNESVTINDGEEKTI